MSKPRKRYVVQTNLNGKFDVMVQVINAKPVYSLSSKDAALEMCLQLNNKLDEDGKSRR